MVRVKIEDWGNNLVVEHLPSMDEGPRKGEGGGRAGGGISIPSTVKRRIKRVKVENRIMSWKILQMKSKRIRKKNKNPKPLHQCVNAFLSS
jgi:hypothetical protein